MINEKNGAYRVTSSSPLADGIMILLFLGGVMCIIAVFFAPLHWGSIALLGAACIAGGVLLNAFKFRKLVAEVSGEGITERVSKVSKGIIRWEEIESVAVYESTLGNNMTQTIDSLYMGTEKVNDLFVGIELKDAAAYAGKLNAIQKGIMKLSISTGHAPINIPCNLLLENTDEFVRLCNDFLVKSRER